MPLGGTGGSPSGGGGVNYSGQLTSSTYARPIPPGGQTPTDCATPTGISGFGNAVRYQAQKIRVDITGTYSIETTSASLTGAANSTDNDFIAVYSPTFNPASTLTNVRYANDNIGGGIFRARVQCMLTAGTGYIVVTSGSNNTTQGTFTNQISGPGTPTMVELIAFSATGYADGVPLAWRTGYEVDNLGFRLYRDEGEQRRSLTPPLAGSALLAGPGTVLGAGRSYHWWDQTPPARRNALYWLEDIDLNGQSTWHGPIVPQPDDGTSPEEFPTHARLLSQLGLGPAHARSTQVGALKSATSALATPIQAGRFPWAGRPAVKVAVKQAGWYRLSRQELIAAGLDPGLNPSSLHLYADGQEQAIAVVGEGGTSGAWAIEIYGIGVEVPWTDTRTYWLVAGSRWGRRIRTLPTGRGTPGASSFVSTVEHRDRTVYYTALRNGEQENFFGAPVAAEPVELELQVPSPDAAPPDAPVLGVRLQAVTLVPHRVQVTLNEVDVGEVVFDGNTAGTATLPLSPTLLSAGMNQVRLTAQAGDRDISLVDYLRLTYWRRDTADQNILWLTASGHHQVTIDSFSQPDIRVMDSTDPHAVREVNALIAPQKAGFAVTFTTPQPGTRVLLAFAGEQVQRPATIVANQPSQWRKSGQGADLIIISHRDFLGSLEPLRALRQGQGLAVTVVDVEDIYDEFSYGQHGPYTVKDFLRYAVQKWKPAPRFVLLVGHASYDPKGYLGYGDSDLVPTKLIDTQLMETAADDWFVDLDDDGLADMAVRRLPVRTTQEASDLVAKIVGYETTAPSNSVLLVAWRNDTYNFEGATMELHSMIPAEMSVEAVFAGQMDADSAIRDLLDSLNRGPRLVNYTGHGSVDLWGNQLLTAADARGLTNRDRLPFVVVMTCLNGYSHDPSLESLAEAFLNAPQGGAIGVWAWSGSTLPEEHALLNQALYGAIVPADELDLPGLTLGRPHSVPRQPLVTAMCSVPGCSLGTRRHAWLRLRETVKQECRDHKD